MYSIIIPIFNAEKYISTMLDSVLSQTYEDFEVICVDDGSKDNSLSILYQYQKKDKRVLVISKENGGPGSARNVGLEKAKGDYLLFFDADDYIDNDYLQVINNIIEKKQYDVLIFDYYSDECNVQNANIVEETWNNNKALEMCAYDKKVAGYLWNKVFSRRVIENNCRDICFNESLFICEDLLFVLEFLLVVKDIYYSNHRFYHYVMQEGSLTNSVKQIWNKRLFTSVEARRKIYNLLNENYSCDKELVDWAKKMYWMECVKWVKKSIFKQTNALNKKEIYELYQDIKKSKSEMLLQDSIPGKIKIYTAVIGGYFLLNLDKIFLQ